MTESHRSQFAEDIMSGLSAQPKYLLSKYLYDSAGSRIFSDIMNIPEYYLTDSEREIFTASKDSMYREFFKDGQDIDIIELGSGDGMKTKILLDYFLEKDASFKYIPVDICEKTLRCLVDSLEDVFPSLAVEERIGDYFKVIRDLNEHDTNRKVIMFLGSNIGNYTGEQTDRFLTQFRDVMGERDKLLIGFDMIKDPNVIDRAYNDPGGRTGDFNLNLLARINRELDADFNLDQFVHYENYDPLTGTAKSYLVSTVEQTVFVKMLDTTFKFGEWETVYVEMSQKYSPDMIRGYAAENGFKIVAEFYDSRRYFVDSVWQID
ncbi:L-histidine N(alpha)-methyltransferase [Candidatus Latescibacterota bacterium]